MTLRFITSCNSSLPRLLIMPQNRVVYPDDPQQNTAWSSTCSDFGHEPRKENPIWILTVQNNHKFWFRSSWRVQLRSLFHLQIKKSEGCSRFCSSTTELKQTNKTIFHDSSHRNRPVATTEVMSSTNTCLVTLYPLRH